MGFGSLLKKKEAGPVAKKINLALQGGGAHGPRSGGDLPGGLTAHSQGGQGRAHLGG